MLTMWNLGGAGGKVSKGEKRGGNGITLPANVITTRHTVLFRPPADARPRRVNLEAQGPQHVIEKSASLQAVAAAAAGGAHDLREEGGGVEADGAGGGVVQLEVFVGDVRDLVDVEGGEVGEGEGGLVPAAVSARELDVLLVAVDLVGGVG